MNPELKNSPIVKYIVLKAIIHLKNQKYNFNEKQIINTDLIPSTKPQKMLSSHPIINKQINNKPLNKIPLQAQKVQNITPQNTMPVQRNTSISSEEFGRLKPLIKDPTITFIECPGENKPLNIIRTGIRQSTKISLSKKEIQEILQTASEKVSIPLIEGVFKVAIDNFLLSAIISNSIGSRFIIKKQTPYSLLQNNIRNI